MGLIGFSKTIPLEQCVGLTSALYVKESFSSAGDLRLEEVSPCPNAGLFIRTRGGETKKASIPKDCVAFQIGEALQVATQGQLRATEHCVFGGDLNDVARNTLAVFLQVRRLAFF
jgi:hypothetical protein